MGEGDPDYAAGHQACAEGKPLYLGLEGWNERRSKFADGWVACLAESAESVRKPPREH